MRSLPAGISTRHRNDIDGLRAIAVVTVVLFHCGFVRFVPGGFVGVDIFFVISGFLITGLVQRDIEAGTFSYVAFYSRRARRIFPALFVMYLAVLVAAFFVLMPSQIGGVAKAVLSSLLFVSNVLFARQAGYFDHASELNVVLHTWSLSVEEQFYILLPPLLAAMRVWRCARRAAAITLLAVGSLVASAWMIQKDQATAFYLVQYRAWELLLGSLLAIGTLPRPTNAWLAGCVTLVGLGLVAGSVLLLNAAIPFPGPAALPATVGAALILYGGMAHETIVQRALAFAPIRFVGLISYSLYLWHWPIWVYGRLAIYDPRGSMGFLCFIAASFVVATLSWWFVERPFRQKPFRLDPLHTLIVAGAYGVLVVMAVATVVPIATVYWQVQSRVEHIASFVEYNAGASYRADVCFLTTTSNEFARFQRHPCLDLRTDKPNYLLIGDSHAAHLYPGLVRNHDVNVLEAAASNCKPTLPLRGAKWCTDLFAFLLDDFLPSHRVDTIIVSARWQPNDTAALPATVRRLAHYARRVVVVGPIVEYDIALPRLLAKAIYAKNNGVVAAYRSAEPAKVDAMMRNALRDTPAIYVSAYDAACPAGHCTLYTSDGEPLQFDYGHLTEAGSVLVVSRAASTIFDRQPAPLARGN